MIGIYKITNKLNGKSYIGQSIHCGKRLDEHCKGNQFIDEIIQLEGIKNFTFEILKDVEKENLSKWEDYYIMKYDTIFPNGYNKRWNTSVEIREQIKKWYKETKEETIEQVKTPHEEIKEETLEQIKTPYEEIKEGTIKKIKIPIPYTKNKSIKLTDKQWIVYYYFLSICDKDFIENDFYKIPKDFLNITFVSKDLSISRPTFYNCISKLVNSNLLVEDKENDCFLVKLPEEGGYIDQQVLSLLLQYQKYFGAELVKTYTILVYIFQNYNKTYLFDKKEFLKLMSHNSDDHSYYPQLKLYLNLLKYWEIVDLETIDNNFKKHYRVRNVNNIDKSYNFKSQTESSITKKMADKIKKEVLKQYY